MQSPRSQNSRNRRSFESFYRPFIVRATIVCASVVVILQMFGVFSRQSGGFALLGVCAVYWLTLSIVRRMTDD